MVQPIASNLAQYSTLSEARPPAQAEASQRQAASALVVGAELDGVEFFSDGALDHSRRRPGVDGEEQPADREGGRAGGIAALVQCGRRDLHQGEHAEKQEDGEALAHAREHCRPLPPEPVEGVLWSG